jgi:DNA-binding LytR/AlgR family response regulator
MRTIHYPDMWLRVIGIPFLAIFLTLFSATEPLYVLFTSERFFLDLAWNLVIILAVTESNRLLIGQLDARYSWITQRYERLLVQGSLALGLSGILATALIYFYNEVLTSRLETFDTYRLMVTELPLILVFVTMQHLIYTGLYLIHYHRITVDNLEVQLDEALRVGEKLKLDRIYNESSEETPDLYQKHLLVNQGVASVPLTTEEIAYIFQINDRCYIKNFTGKDFTSNSSLENLELILHPALFFRLNRQVLANVHSIKHFKQDSNGKLSVELEPPFMEEVCVSKRKAPEFREWLGKKI